MKNFIYLLNWLPQLVFSQPDVEISNILIGYWEGAFIKNNSYQKIDINSRKEMVTFSGFKLWTNGILTFGEFEVPVQIDSIGQISFGTGYGKAKIDLR
ncbi:hypothetical protein SB49_00020 [Sediminicola sp. YIK13]|uniref:hypothetical protein n=1 Tax=Sediminicola sp. YIK13 TaxID=1453352 RepID=UPI00072303E7|nr:hypothetical protein [Sediminicola sp. YIK13]ALM06381.1 hypothetical protein SB49_00020 [Sediminicola sp. YIK13]